MAQIIEINSNTLASDIEAMQQNLGNIINDVENMYAAIAMLDGMWDGPANIAFRQQFLKDKEDMDGVCQEIQHLIDCMTFAKDEYNNCENEISSIINAIRV